MKADRPFRLAASFAITVAVAYTLCTLVFALFPQASLAFMNALFHGLDFSPLQAAGGFDFAGYAASLAGLSAWAFLMALLFAWVLRFDARA